MVLNYRVYFILLSFMFNIELLNIMDMAKSENKDVYPIHPSLFNRARLQHVDLLRQSHHI